MDQIISPIFHTQSTAILTSLVGRVARDPLLSQSYITSLRLCIDASTRACVNIKMASPKPRDERPIEHRRDVLLRLEISVSEDPFGVDPLEYCIKVPKTKSVKKVGSRIGRTVLDLRLEVQGATTDKALLSACRTCSNRESSPSANIPMVDFVAKEDLINVEGGKANIAFRFLCLSGHHGTMDKAYKCTNTTIPKFTTDAPTD